MEDALTREMRKNIKTGMHFNDFTIHALPVVYSFSQQENSAEYDVMMTPTAWFHDKFTNTMNSVAY